MIKKTIGSILMIIGTSFGAGMIALPIVSAHENIIMTCTLLFSSWLMMTIGAYSLLEVNYWLPTKANMISMADKTLGKWGKYLIWSIYLLLLYSLICAYLSGLSDVIQGLLANFSIFIPRWSATLLGLIFFGFIVYRGIGSVDIINRGFMTIKLLAYLSLITLMVKHIEWHLIFEGDYRWRNSVYTVMLTAFGYAIIIPSLRDYLNDDKKLIKKVVFIGSLIPFLLYLLWIIVIQGLISKHSPGGLIYILSSPNMNSVLMNNLAAVINQSFVGTIVKVFISICAITAFLGVSICLTDFISDGIRKIGHRKLLVFLISYLPPLIIVLLFPSIFIKALDYAGIWCLFLLIIIPLLMLYFGRYRLGLDQDKLLPLGKKSILALIFISCSLLLFNLGLLIQDAIRFI